MDAIQSLLPTALRLSLLLLVFSVGLRVPPGATMSLLRSPGILLRSILAIDVVVPLFAILLVALLPLTGIVKLAIVLMAISPVPPVVPGKELKFGGDPSFVCGMLVVISLLAIVTVPVWVAIVNALFPANLQVAPAALARLVTIGVLLPVAGGMAVHALWPVAAERAAHPVSVFANVLLVLAVIPVIAAVWPAMTALIGNGAVLAIIAMSLAGLAAGHLLGGPDERTRTSLAFAAATRHPGIALLIGRASYDDPRLPAAILLFAVAGAFAAIPYQSWRKRMSALRASQPVAGARVSRGR
jgi:BASS family bile acid:Na+ symporter